MIIFISGPITNNPTYREQFAEAETRLTEQGHIILNPAVFPEGMPYESYMVICFAMIGVSDAIYQLRGWDESSGAIRERSRATMLGIKVIEEA